MDAVTREVAALVSAWPEVEAVVQGGSRATFLADVRSDVDLYVYSHAGVPVAKRRALIEVRASSAEIDNCVFETGDEWQERADGTAFDVMYRRCKWIEGEMDRVLVRHEASLGYTTTLWHNVLTSQVLFDRAGWFAGLQARVRVPYPDELVRAIVRKNYPLLRDTRSSFAKQIVNAVSRADVVAVNHRIAAFLASYFDIVFAANRKPHPGEKRLLQQAAMLPHVPADLAGGIQALVHAGVACDEAASRRTIDYLVDGLDTVLSSCGMRCDPCTCEHDSGTPMERKP